MIRIGSVLVASALVLGACGQDRQPATRAPAPVAAAPAPAAVPVAPGPSMRTAVVSAASANLRESASNSARRIALLPRGTEVDVIEFVGGWAKVRSGGNEGYVLARSLRPE